MVALRDPDCSKAKTETPMKMNLIRALGPKISIAAASAATHPRVLGRGRRPCNRSTPTHQPPGRTSYGANERSGNQIPRRNEVATTIRTVLIAPLSIDEAMPFELGQMTGKKRSIIRRMYSQVHLGRSQMLLQKARSNYMGLKHSYGATVIADRNDLIDSANCADGETVG